MAINMVQEVQGQAIRIMRQTYGENKDRYKIILVKYDLWQVYQGI